MGLTIQFVKNMTLQDSSFFVGMDDREYEEWQEQVMQDKPWYKLASNPFPRALDSIELGDLQRPILFGESMGDINFSYMEFGEFRTELSQLANGHEPRYFWRRVSDAGQWQKPEIPDGEELRDGDPYDVPFMDIIHFFDNEGALGPEAIKRLAKSFNDAATPPENGLQIKSFEEQFLEKFPLKGYTYFGQHYLHLKELVLNAAKEQSPGAIYG